ncbi:hypothetical protein PSU4_36080 [Pseudonocardia sulfidoxydans NBRC 16205]|uniref:BD-FAE-like domain-containing protein n=1 Tax=Pseudonocardia sulfidoxydans NBRC 16205 TaxID=1223511 RepID=A0A511DLJ5_9PSEU|nr:prolyl oligopeptidase family serine peptidase [Pseudonocardia sulfidoxydans]GEL24654.1 hypothetical protein PSU4_36080 [Pseudonocardia sulfidoxydans NBRC 16205]
MSTPTRLDYGTDPAQFAELTLPPDGAQPRGTIVVIHGGFWRSRHDLALGRPLAATLAGAGFAAWNIEYRRVGTGGGWPATFDDVAAAVDLLADQEWLDPDRVVALGHSAGGHLAAWLAARPGLPTGTPGADPRVRLRGAVSQAGVLDLVDGARNGVGNGAIEDLLGSPLPGDGRYELASPAERLPVGVPVICVHGDADVNVPVRQSERYVAAAQAAGDPAELVVLPGVEHFAVIDPATEAWRACESAVARLLA